MIIEPFDFTDYELEGRYNHWKDCPISRFLKGMYPEHKDTIVVHPFKLTLDGEKWYDLYGGNCKNIEAIQDGKAASAIEIVGL